MRPVAFSCSSPTPTPVPVARRNPEPRPLPNDGERLLAIYRCVGGAGFWTDVTRILRDALQIRRVMVCARDSHAVLADAREEGMDARAWHPSMAMVPEQCHDVVQLGGGSPDSREGILESADSSWYAVSLGVEVLVVQVSIGGSRDELVRTSLAAFRAHLVVAARNHRALKVTEGYSRGLTLLLEAQPEGVAFVDAYGRVCLKNRRLASLLANDERWFSCRGILRHPDRKQEERSLHLVDWKRRGWRAELPDGSFCELLYLPAEELHLTGRQGGGIVLVAPAEGGVEASTERLEGVFKLTPAEARVVAQVCTGAPLAQVAQTLGVRTNTVRTQLSLAFTKLGVRRQSAVVGRVLGGLSRFWRRTN